MSPTPSYRDDAHAVVIGINQYQDLAIPDLRFARADAEGVYAVLTDPEIGRFNPELVTLLVDEQATERNIRRAIGTRLPRRAQPGHTVFVYYAGHGAPLIDPVGRSADGMEKYLIPYDAIVDDLRSSAIPMDAIQRFFEWINATNVIFFIDTCYSGGAGGRSFDIPGFQTRAAILSDEFLDSLVANEGRYVVTACSTNEVSLETPDLGHGIFTYYLMKGLRGDADADQNGLVGVDELYDYVHRNVTRHASSLGGRMNPIRKGSARGAVFLTQYETVKQHRAREAGVGAAAAFDHGDSTEAERLWAEVLTLDSSNKAAREGLAVIRARREEAERARQEEERRQQDLLIRRLLVLRGYQRPGELSKQLFAQAVELLEKESSELTPEERDVREYVEHLTDGEITVSQYVRAIKLLSMAPPPAPAPSSKAGVTGEPSSVPTPTPSAEAISEPSSDDGNPSKELPAALGAATSAAPTDEESPVVEEAGETLNYPDTQAAASRWQDAENPPELFVPDQTPRFSALTILAVVLALVVFGGWLVMDRGQTPSDETAYPYTSSGPDSTEGGLTTGVAPTDSTATTGTSGEPPATAADTAVAPVIRHTNGPFSSWEVSTPARSISEARVSYGESLFAGHPKESILAEFIIDTFGRPEKKSIKLRSLAETEIADSVRAKVPQMRYQPAESEGRKVRQYDVAIWDFESKAPSSLEQISGAALGEKRLLGGHFLSYNICCGTGVAMVRPEAGELDLWGRIRGEQDSVFLKGKVVIADENTFYLTGLVVTNHPDSHVPCVRRGKFTFKIRGERRFWRMQQISNPCANHADYIDIYY